MELEDLSNQMNEEKIKSRCRFFKKASSKFKINKSKGDESIEDAVGDVKYTDSTKSILTCNVYTDDFTDSSPERCGGSSGRDTYVLDDASDDGDAYRPMEFGRVPEFRGTLLAAAGRSLDLPNEGDGVVGSIAEGLRTRTLVTHEIFTQTSRTIMEIGRMEGLLKIADVKTQTSYISITKNEAVCYEGEDALKRYDSPERRIPLAAGDGENARIPSRCADGDLKRYVYRHARTDRGVLRADDAEEKSSDDTEPSADTESHIEKDSLMSDSDTDDVYENFNRGNDDGDGSIRNGSRDVETGEFYGELTETSGTHETPELRNLVPSKSKTIEPLAEETERSLINITPQNVIRTPRRQRGFDAPNRSRRDGGERSGRCFKLPHVHDDGPHRTGPRLRILFSIDPHRRDPDEIGASTRPFDVRSETVSYDTLRIGRKESLRSDFVRLPPIRSKVEGFRDVNAIRQVLDGDRERGSPESTSSTLPICIRKRIDELKHCALTSADDANASTILAGVCGALAERGDDAVCAHFLRRLRSDTWSEVSEALEELPAVLGGRWRRIPDHWVALLVRQVVTHVESPRLAVACGACATLAAILKNTNYTKKPDFHEAVTCLLGKTGSCSRPMRRAANLALDELVCAASGADHALAALCVHGLGHKNALVRCALARLVLVCAALAGAGRGLLRARPPSAAAARRHALRALAALLDDRHLGTRRYAERLYAMLRPLKNFEAYYLTDVDVDLAVSQMKKYDRMLSPAPPPPAPPAGPAPQHARAGAGR